MCWSKQRVDQIKLKRLSTVRLWEKNVERLLSCVKLWPLMTEQHLVSRTSCQLLQLTDASLTGRWGFCASGEAPSHGWWLHQAGSHLASVLWIWSMQQKVDINPWWSSVGLKMRHKCSLNVKKVTLKLKRNGNLKQTFKTFVCEGSPSSRWGYPEVVSWQLLSLTKPVGREAKRFFIQEVQKEDQLPSINFWIGGSLENKKVIVQVKYKIQQTETWRRSCENALLNFDELYTHPAPEKLIPRVHSPPPHLWAQTWVLGKSHINMLTSYQCQVQPVDGKKAESAGDI